MQYATKRSYYIPVFIQLQPINTLEIHFKWREIRPHYPSFLLIIFYLFWPCYTYYLTIYIFNSVTICTSGSQWDAYLSFMLSLFIYTYLDYCSIISYSLPKKGGAHCNRFSNPLLPTTILLTIYLPKISYYLLLLTNVLPIIDLLRIIDIYLFTNY